MAGMFYTIQEVAKKLSKTEEQIHELVKEGKLREFRDGAKILFKINEVDALAGPAATPFAEETAISLTPFEDAGSAVKGGSSLGPIDLSEDILPPSGPGGSTSSAIPIDLADESTDMSKADTQITANEGLSVLGEMDSEFKITDDTMGKTHAASTSGSEPSLEKIEEDVNLDSFGSGSGLLDLSLQADDTSLGGVLDEIYPGTEAAPGEPASMTPAAPMDMAAEADQMLSETTVAAAEPVAAVAGYNEPEPDAMSNMMGLMLAVPLLAVIYAMIIAVAAMQGITPVILTAVQEIVWFVLIGAAVVSLLIMGVGVIFGGKSRTPKTA